MLHRILVTTAEDSHEFGALNTLLLVLVLGLCILSAYLVKIYKFYYLPESAAAILVGLLVGALARVLYPKDRDELDFLSFQPELFFFLLLPPIIFEAGYTLRKKSFFSNFWTITMYAVGGTLMSTLVIGTLVFWLGKAGIVPIDKRNPMEALIFGSLISAVDPVATLSIIGSPELNCNPLLYSLVFGESVLNDAVAIVLFRTFSQYYSEDVPFTRDTLVQAFLSFFFVSLGSIFAGFVMALGCCYICKHTKLRDYPKYEVSLLFLFAYGSYALAEATALSGVMSLFFCGVLLSHYNSYNLSKQSQIASEHIFKSLGVMSEFLVFLYMGMGFFTGRFKKWNPVFIAFATVICLGARALNIFPISIIANLGRRQKIPFSMQVVIWFSGLRGAIAFALAQNMPGPRRDLYTTTTLCICIATTVVCGGLTEPMLDRMGMKVLPRGSELEVPIARNGSAHEHHHLSDDDPVDRDLTMTASARRWGQNNGGLHKWWKTFDNNWMKPIFGGNLEEALVFTADTGEDEVQELIERRRRNEPLPSARQRVAAEREVSMDVDQMGDGLPMVVRGHAQERRMARTVPGPAPQRLVKYLPPADNEGL